MTEKSLTIVSKRAVSSNVDIVLLAEFQKLRLREEGMRLDLVGNLQHE